MIVILILFFTVAVILIFLKNKRPNNFPPGPDPIPFFGNLFQVPEGHMYPTVEEWAKKYGPIIGLTMVSQLLVLVTGADHVLAALRKEEFQSRPDGFSVRDRSFGKCLGIFFSTGEQWATSRKFAMKQIRAYGKNEKENVICDEISRLVEGIEDGSTVPANGLTGLLSINVIWTIVASQRIDVDDEKSRKFLRNLYEVFRQGSSSGKELADIFPFLRFCLPKHKFTTKVFKETQDYIRDAIEEHKKNLDPNNPMDLIDHYLVESERNEDSPNPLMTEENLIMIGVDLFSAGSEATSSAVEMVLLYMVLYPEVQAKVQEELDRVLGRSRKPVLDDRSQMHYTMAVLNEVERINSITPTSAIHHCNKDTTFGGYFIPKDTLISMNLRALGHDPQYWKDPDVFSPERFLDDDGKYAKSNICHTFGLECRDQFYFNTLAAVHTPRMHYTMAVLNEVERINSITPTSAIHHCNKDTTFGGYFIPKDTLISMNLRALGHDPQYWKDPDVFSPERFLDDDGKYAKSNICHTFGLGQRSCVGEIVARSIIFMFTATFFEKFSISVPVGEPKPSTFALPGFTSAPQPFNITVHSRY